VTRDVSVIIDSNALHLEFYNDLFGYLNFIQWGHTLLKCIINWIQIKYNFRVRTLVISYYAHCLRIYL